MSYLVHNADLVRLRIGSTSMMTCMQMGQFCARIGGQMFLGAADKDPLPEGSGALP
jgi:hypothetical protein